MAGWHVQEVSPAKGRGVLADRAHAPCEVVLDDQPYAWALIGDQLGGYCDCCLAPASQPLRCSACKLACYASKEHQARAWRAGHREECAALRSCAPRAPPTAVRLALRCALRHWRAEQQQTAGGGQDDALRRHAELLGLRHHWERLPDGSKLQYAQMGALAHQLLRAAVPEAAERQGPRDLALLVARFAANSHTIADDELAPMAVGIYPLGAMVNHDCRPNAVHTFAAGGRMVFRAVQPIQPGEEVTTSYTELAATRWERRRELLSHHAFDIDAPQAEAPARAAGAAASSSSPADAAAGAGAAEDPSAMQQALHCLPSVQPAAVLPLGGGAELRLYSSGAPPWPHDSRDAELTALAGGPAAGGMWGCLGQPAAGAADASPASASFDVGDDEAGPSAAAAASGAEEQPPAPSIVHCWSGGEQHPEAQQQQQQVQQLAVRYVAALQLQAALDGMLAAGQAAVAVQQLQGALQGLAPRQPGAAAASGEGGRLALGPRHLLRLRLLADLHRAAVAAAEWEAALAAAYDLLPLYQRVYPAVWPQVGLLWAGVAKIEHLLERPHKALEAAEQAIRILGATHGGSGSAVAAAARVKFEAQQELLHRRQALPGGGSDDD